MLAAGATARSCHQRWWPLRLEVVHEVAMQFLGGSPQITLAGSLALPAVPRPHASILLVSGSGAHDRDQLVAGHRTFLVLKDKLVGKGFAVLRVDDRGTGLSSGDAAHTAFADAVADVRAGVIALRAHPALDPSRIVLVGHSEGGLVAAAAAHDAPVAAVVMLAGPACPIDQLLHHQSEAYASASGATAAQIVHERAMNENVFQIAAGPLADDLALAAAEEVIAAHLGAWPHPAPTIDGDLGEVARAMAGVVISPPFRSLLRQRPMEILKRLTCPVLAVLGDKDTQVPPALNLEPVQRAIAGTSNLGSRAIVLPGLNHLFQEAQSGLIEEYEQITHVMHDRMVEVAAAWLRDLDHVPAGANR